MLIGSSKKKAGLLDRSLPAKPFQFVFTQYILTLQKDTNIIIDVSTIAYLEQFSAWDNINMKFKRLLFFFSNVFSNPL